MGYVSYEITLYLPDGTPASGAEIVATNENAIFYSSKKRYGTTSKEGYYKWPTLATGFNNDTYNFKARKDVDGILYVAYWTDRVSPSDGPYSKEITMRTRFFDEIKKFELPSYAIEGLKNEKENKILELLNEYNGCFTYKLPDASISVGSKILEGLSKILLKRLGKWNEEKDGQNYTFGQLIGFLKDTDFSKTAIYDKLSGFNSFRKPAVHYKGTNSTTDEANLGKSIILDFLEYLFSEKNI